MAGSDDRQRRAAVAQDSPEFQDFLADVPHSLQESLKGQEEETTETYRAS